jgi:hypothetical protein
MAGTAEKAALIAEIATTRVRLAQATDQLRAATDFPMRARRNFQRNRGKWFIAAVLTGLALSQLRKRKEIVYVERSTGDILGSAGKAGMLWGGLKLLGGLAKPALTELAKARAVGLVARLIALRTGRTPEQGRHM